MMNCYNILIENKRFIITQRMELTSVEAYPSHLPETILFLVNPRAATKPIELPVINQARERITAILNMFSLIIT
jgi:hypothetical protein